MALFNLKEFVSAMPPGARLIGLDPGARRIGVALSDVNRRIASPYTTLLRGKLRHNAAEILAIAEAEGALGLIIGIPLGPDQDYGPAAQAARDWAHALTSATGLPGAMHDESLTTSTVQATMIEANFSRARRAAMVDRLAAAQILQEALDSVNTAIA
jgi:putative Holliday junction resolvase